MPTIEMSAGFGAGIASRMIRLGDINSATQSNAANAGLLNAVSYGSGGNPQAYFYLMRGTPPVGFPPNVLSRASDILVTYSPNSANNGGGNFITTQTGTNPAVVSTEYVTAGASGACTWFWWILAGSVTSGASPVNQSVTPVQQIIGTVGLPGTGNDLEIPNVNIVAGEQYRILNLRLQFPTSWNY